MAGHSKWANVKHKKAKQDSTRGKVFTKVSREITVAAREGGGDPEGNFRLRIAIQAARDVNMPNDNIERAIKRGTGEIEGEALEELYYEGYGPGGVAFYVQCLTDNRNRTAADLRFIFSKHGGNMGEAGCVAWNFEKKGVLLIEVEEVKDSEALVLEVLEAGAEDMVTGEEGVEIITPPGMFQAVKEALDAAGYRIAHAQVGPLASNTTQVDASLAHEVQRLIDALDDNDDVQEVFTNMA